MSVRRRIACSLLAGAILPMAASGDAVYLKNGQSFEDVEATVSGDHVRIDLTIGSMRIAMSQVDRIDEVDTALGEYRAREARLRQDESGAAGWLELASWARAHDLDRGAEKAALHAARLEPELDGLAPLLTSLGFVFDDGGREWVPYAESMRRQGLVEDGGDWVTPDEKRERAGDGTEVADSNSSRTDDHLDKALDILADAVNKPEPAPPAVNTTVIVGGGFGGLGFWPGFVPGGLPAPVLHPPGIGSALPFSLSGTFFTGDAKVTRTTTWNQMTLRQPGSFIPATPRFFR
jgi:hypothetical protein